MVKKSLRKFNALVEALQTLPTVGQKSATRLAYHMIMNDSFNAVKLAHAIENAIGSLRKCSSCGGMSEDELCEICSDSERDCNTLCIVENAKDIMIIEQNSYFDGRYFVLESLDDFDMDHLRLMVSSGIDEVVFALTPSIANDAIILYIEDKLSSFNINFSKIAQGVPTGVSLENIDMLSLSRAMQDRVKV
ncbi:MAG: recombination mediator RecR [Campylobacterota bacterium]|nr:recombination mediator RecR [Campylobacterota bacterium]